MHEIAVCERNTKLPMQNIIISNYMVFNAVRGMQHLSWGLKAAIQYSATPCAVLSFLTNSSHCTGIKGGWPGQMRCNMGADSKMEKNLGHNLTITQLVSLPKSRLQTTTRVMVVPWCLLCIFCAV